MQKDIGYQNEYKTKLIKKGVEDGNRKVVYFVPNSFSQSIRFLTEHMRTGAPATHPDLKLDVFLVTVSPMDRHGYFTFGTNNDYTSTAARAVKRLIVEVNQHMPRVFGRSQLCAGSGLRAHSRSRNCFGHTLAVSSKTKQVRCL